MLGDVDCLAVTYPRQHLTRVVAQVPQAHSVRFRSHAMSVLQNCGHKWPMVPRLRLSLRVRDQGRRAAATLIVATLIVASVQA